MRRTTESGEGVLRSANWAPNIGEMIV